MIQTKATIQPILNDQSLCYEIKVIQRSQLGGIAEEHKIQTFVEKQYIRTMEQGPIYRINVLQREQTTANLLRDIENDLAFLPQSIAVQTDHTGAITRVMNLNEINEKWQNYRHNFYKTYTKEKDIAAQDLNAIIAHTDTLLTNETAFTDTFKASEIASMLFPNIYGQLSDEGQMATHHKTFSHFFGNIALPLQLNTTLTQKGSTAHLFRKGILDEDTFQYPEVRRYFRQLLDNYKLKIPIETTYLETYDLNHEHWITHAGQLFTVTIPSVFSFEQIVSVSQNTLTP